MRYRTPDGTTELALIEWKYTEQYQGHSLSGGDSSMRVRQDPYRELFHDPGAPIRTDVIAYEAFFAEPLYQLMRQQLLAWRMECDSGLGLDRARVVVVAPSLNRALHASYDPELATAAGLGAGSGVHELWRALLRRPDRFAVLDSADLVAPAHRSPTSSDRGTATSHPLHPLRLLDDRRSR